MHNPIEIDVEIRISESATGHHQILAGDVAPAEIGKRFAIGKIEAFLNVVHIRHYATAFLDAGVGRDISASVIAQASEAVIDGPPPRRQ
jgi:hypothetical protein